MIKEKEIKTPYDENDYEKDIEVDKYSLDIQNEEMPNLADKYGKIVEEARDGMERKKVKVDLMKADLDDNIRKNNKEKLTEAKILNLILRDEEYQKEMSDYLDAIHSYKIALIAYNSVVVEKRSSIDNLVKLFGSQYFSRTSLKGKEYEEGEKSLVREKIKRGLNSEK